MADLGFGHKGGSFTWRINKIKNHLHEVVKAMFERLRGRQDLHAQKLTIEKALTHDRTLEMVETPHANRLLFVIVEVVKY